VLRLQKSGKGETGEHWFLDMIGEDAVIAASWAICAPTIPNKSSGGQLLF
jgi:hypothetical protein